MCIGVSSTYLCCSLYSVGAASESVLLSSTFVCLENKITFVLTMNLILIIQNLNLITQHYKMSIILGTKLNDLSLNGST